MSHEVIYYMSCLKRQRQKNKNKKVFKKLLTSTKQCARMNELLLRTADNKKNIKNTFIDDNMCRDVERYEH